MSSRSPPSELLLRGLGHLLVAVLKGEAVGLERASEAASAGGRPCAGGSRGTFHARQRGISGVPPMRLVARC